jgi:hypothetical protein
MPENKCPFGCDEPWPHPPGGCMFCLSAKDYDFIAATLNEPPKPTPAAIEAAKRYWEIVTQGRNK